MLGYTILPNGILTFPTAKLEQLIKSKDNMVKKTTTYVAILNVCVLRMYFLAFVNLFLLNVCLVEI